MRSTASHTDVTHVTDLTTVDDLSDEETRIVSRPAPSPVESLTLRDFLSRVWQQVQTLGEECLDQPIALSLRDGSGRTHAGRLASVSVDRISRARRAVMQPTVVLSVTLSGSPRSSSGWGQGGDVPGVVLGSTPPVGARDPDEDRTGRVHRPSIPRAAQDERDVEVVDVESWQVVDTREVAGSGDDDQECAEDAGCGGEAAGPGDGGQGEAAPRLPRFPTTIIGQTVEALRQPGPVTGQMVESLRQPGPARRPSVYRRRRAR